MVEILSVCDDMTRRRSHSIHDTLHPTPSLLTTWRLERELIVNHNQLLELHILNALDVKLKVMSQNFHANCLKICML